MYTTIYPLYYHTSLTENDNYKHDNYKHDNYKHDNDVLSSRKVHHAQITIND